jgi:hypothetical protein
VINNHQEFVQWAIARGARLNHLNNLEDSCYQIADRQGNHEMLDLLKAFGCLPKPGPPRWVVVGMVILEILEALGDDDYVFH